MSEDTAKKDGFAKVSEAAGFLSLGRSTIYQLMDTGKLSYAKFGTARRIPWKAIYEFAEKSVVRA